MKFLTTSLLCAALAATSTIVKAEDPNANMAGVENKMAPGPTNINSGAGFMTCNLQQSKPPIIINPDGTITIDCSGLLPLYNNRVEHFVVKIPPVLHRKNNSVPCQQVPQISQPSIGGGNVGIPISPCQLLQKPSFPGGIGGGGGGAPCQLQKLPPTGLNQGPCYSQGGVSYVGSADPNLRAAVQVSPATAPAA